MPNQAVIQAANGSLREVPIGVRFRLEPGEQVIGRRVVASSLLDESRSSMGVGLGDIVAFVTKKFGVKPCAPCNKRRQRLNKYRLRTPIFKVK